MRGVVRATERLALYMSRASGLLLILMMAIVLADVVTRALFGATGGRLDLTFNGGVELVSYTLLFCVLFALPHAVRRGQVTVGLFTRGMSERLKRMLAGVYTLGFGLFGLGMTVRLYGAVGRLRATGETTQDLLVPMWTLYALAALAATVLTIRGVLSAFQNLAWSGREA
jgi:TRAP-type mannitol/chloroaromatic compound transport system permease small subunit